MAARTGAEAHASAAHAASHSAATAFTAASAFLAIAFAALAAGLLAGGALAGDRDVGGDGGEVERLADIVAERDDEFSGVDRTAGGHLVGGLAGEADMLLRAEQDDVGEGGLH